MSAEVTYCEHDLPYFICGACAWKADPRPRAMRPDGSWLSPDPVRPPDTDEEPWQIAVADLDPLAPARGMIAGFLLAAPFWISLALLIGWLARR